MHTRALFQPATINDTDRTVDVVFATEREVVMYNWSIGRFKEILVCNDTAGDLTRLNNGASLLDIHKTEGGVRSILGSVVPGSAKFVNNQGLATIRFSSRKDVDGVWQDVKDGHLSGVSVGYVPTTYEEIKSVENTIPTLRATKWEATEISMAPVQADRDSMVRSDGDNTPHNITIIRTNSNPNIMTPEELAAQAAERKRVSEIYKACRAANLPEAFSQGLIDGNNTIEQARAAIQTEAQRIAAVPAPVNETEVRAAATSAERTRVKDINTACRAAKLDDAFAEKLIEDGTDINQARALIIDKMAESETALPGANAGSVRVTADVADKERKVIIAAVGMRAGQVSKDMPAELKSAANAFRHFTLMDLAKRSLELAGVEYRGLHPMEIVGRAITSSTSDFSILLGGVIHQTLLANYAIAADTWRGFCHIGSVTDFRPHSRIRRGSFSRLDEVKEDAEFKTKAIPDGSKESVQAKTFGNIINVSRQMIINDDLGAFNDLASDLGRAAARSIEEDVYALFALNSGAGPTMADSKALFHADHGNIGTAGVMTVTTLDELRQKMALQKDNSNNDYLSITPKTLLVPTALSGLAKTLNGAQYDPSVTNKFMVPNIVNGMFSTIVDTPRLPNATQYIAFADPAVEPVLEVSFLNGVQEPFLEQRQGFGVDGMEWKVRHDYGVGAVGWKGAVKNAGG